MFVLNIRITAKDDIQQIVDYYDEINKNISDVFLEELFTNLDHIRSNPFAFQKKYKNIRVCYLKSFSFGIHYRVIEKVIEVLAVLHTSRNPDMWNHL